MTVLSSRSAFRNELLEQAKVNPKILDVEADLGGQQNTFEKAFPERYFNIGIAESASLDLCVGLESAGWCPVFSTFAPFVALRAAENIKLDMGYMNRHIVVASCYGGAAGGWFGTTHQSLEDLALIRSLPNIKIGCPYGESETRRLLDFAVSSSNPWYIRLGRNNQYPNYLSSDQVKTTWSWYKTISKETTVCVISSGEVATDFCIQITNKCESVSHLHVVQSDIDSVTKLRSILAKIHVPIIVVEEYRYAGSLAELIQAQNKQQEIYAYTVNDAWPIYGGDHYEVLKYLNFSAKGLFDKVRNLQGRLGIEHS